MNEQHKRQNQIRSNRGGDDDYDYSKTSNYYGLTDDY